MATIKKLTTSREGSAASLCYFRLLALRLLSHFTIGAYYIDAMEKIFIFWRVELL